MSLPPAWLHGLFAVLPTPMVAGGGLDLDSLDRVVDHYLAGGATGLVPASIAGEGDLLDEGERRLVIQRVVERCAGRAPVVVGVLEDGIECALAQARVAADCGADGLLVKVPTGDPQDVLAHVARIAQAQRLPIILLDNPKFGGRLPLSLIRDLVDTVPEVCGIKLEEEPTAEKMSRVRDLLGPRIRIFGGLGGVHCLSELAHGADGFFTGYPQPELLARVMACWRRGDRAAAGIANAAFLPIALQERAHPATMISQRKTILRDCGVLREAVVRSRASEQRQAMPADAALNLLPLQFAAAFPFHIVLDERLCVLQTGSVLSRLCPEVVPGTSLGERFVVQRPDLKSPDFDAILRHDKTLFVLQYRDGPLRLRGQFVAQDRRLFFLGSPWVSAMHDVTRIGLSLRDFAIHDPVVDLLFLLQTKNKSLDDGQVLSQRLRASQQRLAEAQELAKLGSWVLDPNTGEIDCSDEARRIYGFTATTVNPTFDRLVALVPAGQRAGLRKAVEQATHGGAPVVFEHRVHASDGTDRWVHLTLQMSTTNDVATVRAAVRDETTNKEATLRLELAHDVARALAADVEPDSAVAFILSAVGAKLGCHAAVCWAAGDDSRVRCLGAWAVAGDAASQQFVATMRAYNGPRPDANLDAAWGSGSPLWRVIQASDAAPQRDQDAGRSGLHAAVVVPVIAGTQLVALEFFNHAPIAFDREVEGFMRSIASQLGQFLLRKQAEAALRHSANHDALTGLASRSLLHERLAHAIRHAARKQTKVAVMFMDLDRFKHINDSLGHTVGDVLLQACADRLRMCVRECDTLARFGGDEFVVVLEGLDSAADIVAPLTKVIDLFSLPFEVKGRELPTTASIGISVYPDDGQDVESLLMSADAAMYRAKETGPGNHHFYSAQMKAKVQQQLALETCLPRALERNELFLVYQPKLDLATGRVTGVEALMRWRHPTLGLVSPLQFIPIAEDTGLIDHFGHWALQVACRAAKKWHDLGYPIQVSVNLSARQLNRPRLAEEVSQVIAEARLRPEQLELEITESCVMHNPVQAALRLRELRDLGVSLAIDDFGTGYSSLSYLRTFPLGTLKIDRSFIKDLPADEDAAALTAGIIALAQRLRMKVVAEGVETLEQLGYLRANGCDEIQGYYLSMPITADEMSRFLERDLRNFVTPTAAA